MAKAIKSKWIIGLTGTALSAFVITQVGANQPNNGIKPAESIVTNSMSAKEKEIVQLDWSNYAINGVAANGVTTSGRVEQSDRQTRRS
jgi:hypothetical protein